MTVRQFTIGVLVTALLAGFAAPCVAAGDDAAATMACCKKHQHEACADPHLAQTCCKTKGAADQDRLIPADTLAAKHAAAISMIPAPPIAVAPAIALFQVHFDVLPARSDGLAARARPLRI